MEVLRERTGHGSGMEVSAKPIHAPTFGVGPSEMGMSGADGDERYVGGRRHVRQLRRLLQSLYGVRPVPVVVVDAPVAGHIFAAGMER